MPSVIRKVKDRFQAQGGFLKSVSILAGGTAFAQAIGVLVLPVITRLYSPQEFALFAIYSSILGILAVATCLRFEIAIPLPRSDENALCLFTLASLSNIFITLLLSVAVLLFEDQIISLIQQPDLKPYLWLIPIGVFFAGLYNTLQYWTTRQKQFSTIAKTRMTQSISSSTVQIAGGYLGFGAIGLIIGQVVNFSAGIIRLFSALWKESGHLFKNISVRKLKKNAKKYDKFPKFSTFEALAHITAIQLPIVIIGAVSEDAEAGYLMLAMKVMAIPTALIGGAIAQVYLSHASEYYNNNELRSYTIETVKKIAKISILPFIAIGIASPFLFPIAFGSEWSEAGYMMVWMIPWFIMQILSSPVSMALHVTGNQKAALMLQLVGFFLRVIVLLLICKIEPDLSFEYYAISGFVFYALYLAVIMRYLRLGEELANGK